MDRRGGGGKAGRRRVWFKCGIDGGRKEDSGRVSEWMGGWVRSWVWVGGWVSRWVMGELGEGAKFG